MKIFCLKMFFLFLFSCGLFINTFAQSDSSKADSVNIGKIIHSQIETIKSKENPEEIKPDVSEVNQAKPVFLGFTEAMLIRMFLIVDLILVAVLFVIWRRRKQRIAAELKAKFKNNIRKLREEKIKGREDTRLKALRKNLQEHEICNDLNENLISSKAKKLSISKGEIYLAAKIKSYNKDDDA